MTNLETKTRGTRVLQNHIHTEILGANIPNQTLHIVESTYCSDSPTWICHYSLNTLRNFTNEDYKSDATFVTSNIAGEFLTLSCWYTVCGLPCGIADDIVCILGDVVHGFTCCSGTINWRGKEADSQ